MILRQLRSIPRTIAVCGLVVGYIAWLEARNAIHKTVRSLRKIVEP